MAADDLDGDFLLETTLDPAAQVDRAHSAPPQGAYELVGADPAAHIVGGKRLSKDRLDEKPVELRLVIEQALADYATAYGFAYAALRYFNAAGARPDGSIGEDHDPESHLIPIVLQVALGQREQITVFGDDYDTADGTGVRDYIHVMDLALAHLKALDLTDRHPGAHAINVGTGQGYSVLDMIAAFKRASNRDIPYQITDRRPGDVATSLADPSLAADLLEWRAERGLDQMCADAWAYECNASV